MPFVVHESRPAAARHKIDIQFPTAYNFLMDTLGQQTPAAEERDSSRLIIMIAVTVVIVRRRDA